MLLVLQLIQIILAVCIHRNKGAAYILRQT